MSKNITILGWYGKNNVGDEAFKPAHRSVFDGHNLTFHTPPDPCPKGDLVVLGGGAVVAPYYLDILPDCPRYALGVDIAYKSEIDLMAKYDFKGVYVRNNTDVEEMKQKLGCPVEGIPDLAFMIRPSGEDVLGRYKKQPNKKTLGVLVTDYVNPAIDRSVEQFSARANSFVTRLAKELDIIYREEGYEIILIPCSTGGYGDDRRINFDLMAFMKNPAINILDTLSPQETIDLIAGLDMAVCMKFHAHIFSIIAATPFVSISFTRKVELLLNENSLNDTTCAKFVGDEFDTGSFRDTIDRVASGDYKNLYHQLALKNHDHLQLIAQRVRRDWLGESS